MSRKGSAPALVITRIPLTKARINLGALIKRVHRGHEAFILEKDGLPVAALTGLDEFEDYLEARDPAVRTIIEESNRDFLEGRSRPADELLRDLEAEQESERRQPDMAR